MSGWSHTSSEAPAPESARGWWYLALALAVFAAGVATEIRLPGLYFDEVNPDYMVVPLVHPEALPNTVWLPPGNYLSGRFPLLVQLYHGALPVYLGLPLYAIFGTGVEGVRIVHGLFGAAVIALAWAWMRASRVAPWIAGAACIALALDPAFLFAFRTHYYILLLPFVPLAAAFLAAGRARVARRRRDALALFAASGLLGAIACYGYFVYFAFVPALAGFALAGSTGVVPRGKALLAGLAGFAAGISPYPIGYGLLVAALGGTEATAAWLASTLSNLQAGIDFGGPLERVFHFIYQLQGMVTAEGFTRFVFSEEVGQLAAGWKTLCLLVIAPATLPLLRAGEAGDRLGFALAGCLAGLFALTLVFGMRLLVHHFVPALPMLYALLAIGAARLAARTPAPAGAASWRPARARRGMAVSVAAMLLSLCGINAVNAQAVYERLRQTRGVWLFHESVTRFAETAARRQGAVFHYFPDWGLFTSFEMITRGRLPFFAEFNGEHARWMLCGGTDVVVATTWGGNWRVPNWTGRMGWREPEIERFRERDGKLLFEAARWSAQAGPQRARPCPR